MKIAILTSGILPVPAVQGGAVENLIDFYLEFNEQHHLHDITVYSVWHPNVKNKNSIQSGYNHYHYVNTSSILAKVKRKIYSLPHQHEYYNSFIEYFFERVWQDIKKKQYDCIILENRPGYAHKLTLRGAENLILHLHNDLLNDKTPHHQEIFQSLSCILTVSDYIKGRVETITRSDKVMTVHNGIDLQQFQRQDTSSVTRRSVGFSDSDFVLVFSGRLNKEKGISELIDAMLLLQDLPNIKLMIIGSTFFGNAANEDEFVRTLKTKALPVKGRFAFTGFVPYEQMPAYLSLADIAVIPSVWDDPFPTTVLEAQAMGLPIITTNRGGIPEEVTQNTAIIVHTEQHYTEGLANAIRQLYYNPQRRSLMKTSAQQHALYFDKVRYACDFFNALESIL